MWFQRVRALSLFLGLLALGSLDARAGVAELLPVQSFGTGRALEAPVANAAFAPAEGALAAPGFTGILDRRDDEHIRERQLWEGEAVAKLGDKRPKVEVDVD
jgi:hypothetical protein